MKITRMDQSALDAANWNFFNQNFFLVEFFPMDFFFSGIFSTGIFSTGIFSTGIFSYLPNESWGYPKLLKNLKVAINYKIKSSNNYLTDTFEIQFSSYLLLSRNGFGSRISLPYHFNLPSLEKRFFQSHCRLHRVLVAELDIGKALGMPGELVAQNGHSVD
ncbi:hypothetical protein BpHYR1_021572 [Brachionus plicatilis]|uniref:Uncharacterized protein n=1 Tax=Brachionus plicatilis TaxID=10195 RepID=A0A3M7S6L9_BRAPC|nr:hypothetical protein BpHYR1_021572 [Brachionus plicatilis]